MKEDLISLIASDMHSLELRPPNLSVAYKFIENKFGIDVKDKLIYNAEKNFSKCLKK